MHGSSVFNGQAMIELNNLKPLMALTSLMGRPSSFDSGCGYVML